VGYLFQKELLILQALADNPFIKIFANPVERFVCVLGNNYAENFLANGTLENGFAILSDKRVYFRGTCFSRMGKKFTKTDEERILDIQDVTGTGFIHKNPLGLLMTAVISSVYAFIWLMSAFSSAEWAVNHPVPGVMGVATIISAISFFIAYFVNRRSLFEIAFAGGAIAFDTSWLNKDEMQTFQRNIRLVKDAFIEQGSVRSTAPSPVPQATPATSNVADELRKYKELYDNGVICEDEYNSIKNRLITKI